MAKFQPIHGDMLGSIGDNTWSVNRGGAYVRRRGNPVNRNTTKQQQIRTILGTVAGEWKNLSTAQRAGWAAWAALNPVVGAFGASRILSGQQAYVSLNARLYLATGVSTVTAPTGTAPAGLITVASSTNNATTITFTFTATPLGGSVKMYVSMCPPGSAGRDPNQKQARFVGFSAGTQASPVTFTTPFALTTGAVANFWISAMAPDGQLSGFLKLRVTLL